MNTLPIEVATDIVILSCNTNKRIWDIPEWITARSPHLRICFVVDKDIINLRLISRNLKAAFEDAYLDLFLFRLLENKSICSLVLKDNTSFERRIKTKLTFLTPNNPIPFLYAIHQFNDKHVFDDEFANFLRTRNMSVATVTKI